MWFETLTGFREDDGLPIAARLRHDGEFLTSTVNGRVMRCGHFEMVDGAELSNRVAAPRHDRPNRVREIVADVRDLHLDPANAGALFQVASQFNTLEMISPSVTPEDGIDRYETDHTQGPACAIACGAGTIVRNYLVDVDGRRGQTATRQLDGLAPMAAALGLRIEMRNGYALPSTEQLDRIAADPALADADRRRALACRLAIGLQWRTEVTLPAGGHTVSQAYCSALPVAYGVAGHWEPFARLVLDAAYEATLAAAVANREDSGSNRVYLTQLGGGVFGNDRAWILDAIDQALSRWAGADLDVVIVSHGRADPALASLLTER
ncbi:MAG: hypothetical protein AAGD35_14010 [Actinomycetota bacterium]